MIRSSPPCYRIDRVGRSPDSGWLNFRVLTGVGVRGGNSRKFSLAWNGSRLALGIELRRLAHAFPSEAESVVEWLEAGCP